MSWRCSILPLAIAIRAPDPVYQAVAASVLCTMDGLTGISNAFANIGFSCSFWSTMSYRISVAEEPGYAISPAVIIRPHSNIDFVTASEMGLKLPGLDVVALQGVSTVHGHGGLGVE